MGIFVRFPLLVCFMILASTGFSRSSTTDGYLTTVAAPELNSASNDTEDTSNNGTNCILPDCYSQQDQENIPGGLQRKHTPQIIIFTYTGSVTEKIRKQVAEIFPNTRKNPNGCPVAITLFIRDTFTDPCTVHEMYTRGHEIAIQSKENLNSNPRNWPPAKWHNQVADYRYNISKKAYIPLDHIQGMRAPNNEPGGDIQFEMLMKEDFMYDSTLKAGPVVLDALQVWPFTLNEPFNHLSCLSHRCPEERYPGFWVVPAVKLTTRDTSCTYLDECVADFETSDEVFNFLVDNFNRNYRTNRAPFQVNLLETTFASKVEKEALKDFLDWVTEADNTWVLTIQETLDWVRKPVRNAVAGGMIAWECPNRNYHRNCREERDEKNKEGTVTYRDFIDVDDLVIFQYVVLVLAYLIILRYDRWLPSDGD